MFNSRALISAFIFAVLTASAQAQDDTSFDIKKVDCGDAMILSRIDRETTLAFMHCYIVGKDGASGTDAEKMANSTDGFLAQCVEKPNAHVLEVMRASISE